MKLLSQLLVVCLLGALYANAQPEDTGEDEQPLGRRYAEATLTSKFSKIMDSMAQKNFVDFLLNHRGKKSKPEEDPEVRLCNDLLKLSMHEKQKRPI